MAPSCPVQVDNIDKECRAEGHTYLFKDRLPVGFFGLVDDLIRVTEAGISAQKLNALINIKSAEKKLKLKDFHREILKKKNA